MTSRVRNLLLAMTMMLVSIGFTLVAGEGVVRLIVNPGDYLRPRLDPDPVLGVKVLPGSAGHDEWGFRNHHVPASAEIVAIGDSQTYGVSAKGSESWPAQLARITKSEVYNLALGGYGPMEYDYLLRTRAIHLDPKTVVVGVYLGNDLLNAYNAVYRRAGREHLRASRDGHPLKGGGAVPAGPEPKFSRVMFAGAREWLVSHSVVYRMAAFSFGELVHRLDVERQARKSTKNFLILSDRDGRLITVFTPESGLYAVNTATWEVQEGIRLSGDVLVGMRDFAEARKIRFQVILIPSKESVYWPVTVKMSEHPDETLVRLIEQEALAKAMLVDRLEKGGVCVEDVLPDLRAQVETKALYPNNDGGHPNKHGYQIIAESVSRILAADPRCGSR